VDLEHARIAPTAGSVSLIQGTLAVALLHRR
jgi:hypothetical protein